MKAKIINLPKIEDPRGNLSFVEGENHIPFEIKEIPHISEEVSTAIIFFISFIFLIIHSYC